MQIVIDISEEDFKLIQSVNNTNLLLLAEARAMLAIKNGTPLPEHHGRLIDGDSLMQLCLNSKDKTIDCNDIARVPIIIPATKEGE